MSVKSVSTDTNKQQHQRQHRRRRRRRRRLHLRLRNKHPTYLFLVTIVVIAIFLSTIVVGEISALEQKVEQGRIIVQQEQARSSTSTTITSTTSMTSKNGGEHEQEQEQEQQQQQQQQLLDLLVPSSFPELVGLSGEDAKTKLRNEYPISSILSTIQVIPDNSMVTMDYREDRVRIFVDEKNR